MSRKRRRKEKHKQPGAPAQGPPPGGAARLPQPGGCGAREGAGPAGEAALAEVARLCAGGQHKAAVRRAKELHKELGSAASERALVGAYAGRIREMLDEGMAPEAEALVRLVHERYPSSAGRLDALGAEVSARGGDLAALVGPLADASAPPEKKAEIEAALRRVLTDPRELAACNALPPEHGLREGARAVAAAFEAATQGPVCDEAIALPQVPRRGPLAPWKWLIRAIALFYRRDDEGCRKCLDAVESDSAVARLVPVLRALVDGSDTGKLPLPRRELVHSVTTQVTRLRQALAELDAAFGHKGSDHRLLGAVRQAITECRRVHPEGVEALRQRISIRGYLRGMGAEQVQQAIGGSSLHDAPFWRLLARAAEMAGGHATACAYWEEFRKHAVHQGWFPAEGVEVAALFRLMLRLLDRSRPEEVDEVRRLARLQPGWLRAYYCDQPPAVVAASAKRLDAPPDYFLSPGFLYPLVCRRDPDPKAFEQWLGWAEEAGGAKEAEVVALRWGEAFPQAAEPFIYLAEACEKRDALKRALKFLSEAEARDPLNPEVRRARVRLLAATVLRHLRQAKPHLLAKDCAELDALPQARERDRPAFVAAARCVGALLEQNRPEADRWRDEVCRIIGGPAACFLLARLLGAVQRAAPEPSFPLEPPAEADGAALAAAVARACSLGEDLGMPFALVPPWAERIAAGLKPEACALDAASLRDLIEAALRAGESELAYRLSGIGLARGGPAAARFLLHRARSIPAWHGLRRAQCFDAVKAMAQRQRDTELLGEAIDLARGRTRARRAFWLDLLPVSERAAMSTAEAQAVVATELAAAEYPASVWDAAPEEGLGGEPPWLEDMEEDTEDELDEECQCPDCRRRRRAEGRKAAEKTPYLFDVESYTTEQRDAIEEDSAGEDDFLDEDESAGGLELPDLPPDMLKLLAQELRRALERGEQPDPNRVIDKILREGANGIPGFRPPPSRRRRKRK